VKPGGFIVEFANEIHYEGAKGDGAVVETVGVGPSTMIRREEK
jgi:hypothetical protein